MAGEMRIVTKTYDVLKLLIPKIAKPFYCYDLFT